jgi:hypothetical protein
VVAVTLDEETAILAVVVLVGDEGRWRDEESDEDDDDDDDDVEGLGRRRWLGKDELVSIVAHSVCLKDEEDWRRRMIEVNEKKSAGRGDIKVQVKDAESTWAAVAARGCVWLY